MAKIMMEFDTISKELVVKMDDEVLEDIQSVCIYKAGYYGDNQGDDYTCSLSQSDKEEDEGYKTMTQIVAKDSTAGREAIVNGAGTYKNNDFVSVKGVSLKLQKDIFNYLRKK